ncbi:MULTISPECIES: CocE/NonD family hydrolase [Subtercola]|uniref:CocE/NonD family hydrolase n=1 Tax=Subtercola vilae TaxID=2056433 RepID=A0A4T2C412_9MICO|nr:MULTISPECIES: CocE/NonD family hydrolase [Subtercola]MEA9985886.1 CocE/NonD family hydrolase [Subtercola sp. RTI3]TIH36918.1 CocE/NonD family hydrolase [Subtercola vilae]
MKIRTEFDRTVTVLTDVSIPMRDGTLLAATIWLPDDAEASPVPALLEYLPYRRSDWTGPRDAQRHPWYAGNGYASVRVDMRGSGDSQGLMLDEYHEQEQADGLEVIAWLAAQPWCTGKVGMFGISWGGFNSLQLAAERPPALAAIVTVCSTDDRYADDVHYYGGAMLGIDMSAWAGTMLAFQSRPPDPAHVGDAWRSMWAARLDALRPFSEIWLAHQERDDYWRHGSVNEDYSAIEAAVLAVGGWADPYRNAVLRLVDKLDAPVKGIVGPWSHQYPDIQRTPGPTIGFLQETLRWWDHWLKGIDTGVMDEPALRLYHQESVRPATHYPVREGSWVGLSSWPSADISSKTFSLASDLRSLATDASNVALIDTPQHHGVDAARWFPFGNLSDLPPDQRAEDGRSVVFETPVLTSDINLLGFARLTLRVSSTAARATVIARLCDVAPDGSSTLITRGAINLLHRNGMDAVDELIPGEFVDAAIEFTAISWHVPAGHKLRLALATTYWPWIWPHGERGSVSIDAAASILTLDDLDPAVIGSSRVSFEEAEQSSPMGVTAGPPPVVRPEREVRYEPQTESYTVTVDPNYGGNRIFPDGLHFSEDALETYFIEQNDPLTARAESEWRISLERGEWKTSIHTHSVITATRHAFELASTVTTFEGDELFFERTYRTSIPRTSA